MQWTCKHAMIYLTQKAFFLLSWIFSKGVCNFIIYICLTAKYVLFPFRPKIHFCVGPILLTLVFFDLIKDCMLVDLLISAFGGFGALMDFPDRFAAQVSDCQCNRSCMHFINFMSLDHILALGIHHHPPSFGRNTTCCTKPRFDFWQQGTQC